jgi:hypothetical protein
MTRHIIAEEDAVVAEEVAEEVEPAAPVEEIAEAVTENVVAEAPVAVELTLNRTCRCRSHCARSEA